MPHIWIRLRSNPSEQDDAVLDPYAPECFRRRPDGQRCCLVRNVDEDEIPKIKRQLGDRAAEFTVLDDDTQAAS